jgi:phosphoribosylaminoimidazolecarboxamide formyltransferase / IMP cyclohydrolase
MTMSDLKKMYSTMTADPFPGEMVLRIGGQELVFKKRTWQLQDGEKGLRYGENPDQPAALYELVAGGLTLDSVRFRGPGQGIISSMSEKEMLQSGKHPGKINLTDVDNGINILQYLTAKPAAVILKHNNPSGAAWSGISIADALRKAYLGDRIAAFGGAVVVNRPLDEETAEFISSVYFEVVAAPSYSGTSLELLRQRRNLRILELPALGELDGLAETPFLDIKSLVDGGLIIQLSFRNRIRTIEDFLPAVAEKDGVTVAARKPTPLEAEDLLFAWAVESGVTSNSVIFAKEGATVSIGTGEQDRVGCVQLAIHKAYTKYADKLAFDEHTLSLYQLREKARSDNGLAEALADIETRTASARAGLPGSVLVSDGFFPFRDGVDLALEQGVVAIAQPGGSIRDIEIIKAVNEAVPQAAMVFTGQRSFKH